MPGAAVETGYFFLVMDKERTHEYEDSKRAVGNQFQRIKMIEKNLNTSIFVIVIPDSSQVDDLRRAQLAEAYGISQDRLDVLQPNILLKEAAEAYAVRLFDPFQCLKDNGGPEMYFKQDVHFSPRGHEIFADCVGEQVESFITYSTQSNSPP